MKREYVKIPRYMYKTCMSQSDEKLRVRKGTKNTKIAEKLISVLRKAETSCRYVIFPQRTKGPAAHRDTKRNNNLPKKNALKYFQFQVKFCKSCICQMGCLWERGDFESNIILIFGKATLEVRQLKNDLKKT